MNVFLSLSLGTVCARDPIRQMAHSVSSMTKLLCDDNDDDGGDGKGACAGGARDGLY